jgi:hypothetical protein
MRYQNTENELQILRNQNARLRGKLRGVRIALLVMLPGLLLLIGYSISTVLR